MKARPTVMLDKAALHPCLDEPVLDSINFLNEVIDRYPQAISFAPGAPAPGFLADLDLNAYLQRYIEHLGQAEGLGAAQVRRRLFQYGPARGIIGPLIAQALQRDEGIELPQQAIVVTVGFQEALLLVLRAICPDPRDVLAVVQPAFVGALGAAHVLGVPMVGINERADGVDLAQLIQTCEHLAREGRRVRALYLAPDFSNPSGTLYGRAHREALLQTAEKLDLLLLEDTAYGFTASRDLAIPTLKALDRQARVIHFGTFAKTCLPGVRVGFVVADQRISGSPPRLLADALTAIKSMTTVNTSPVCQAIVGGMLLDRGVSLATLAQDKGSYYRERLHTLLAALERHVGTVPALRGRVRWNRPAGGFFVRVQVPATVDTALLELSAREYGVLWTPMAGFYVDDGGQHELRLSCSYLDDTQIDEGVCRLACFLQDQRVCA